ncbi:MAG: phospholipid carrier-dependent glycosyltransferase [Candidatus Paceibacterota bacterium]
MKRYFSLTSSLALIAILIFAWLTRIYHLNFPSGFVFDETYHVPAIRLIAENDPRAFEWWHGPIYSVDHYDWLHPPLAKYLQAWSWMEFDQTAFAWRLPAVLFGVVGVLLTFVVAQLAFHRRTISLLAALLLALDGLWLVQSRVAMNDIFMAVWLLAAVAVYLWYKQRRQLKLLLLVGFLGGLGLATKWSAGLWLIGLLIWESIEQIRAKDGRLLPWVFFCLIVLPLSLYVVSFLPMFLQNKDINYFISLHIQIWRYQILGAGTHPYQSGPVSWLLNWRPVWYWSNGTDRQIYALNNPLLVWFELGALILLFAGLLKKAKQQVRYSLDLLLMLMGVLLIPWLFSPRIAFYYHYTPVAPIMAILLAYTLDAIYLGRSTRYAKLIFLLLISSLIWTFWLYYPNWVGLPVTEEFRQTVYWLLPSWR